MTSVVFRFYRSKKRNTGDLPMQLISSSAVLLDAVARAGSFRRAAENLNMSASAINRQILNLEEDVGLPLLERLPRGVRPTAAGERLLADIRRWRREQDIAAGQLRDLKGQRRGSISIGAMECFAAAFLPDAIKALQAEMPLVETEVVIGGGDDLLRRLTAKEIDMALIFNPPTRLQADIVYSLRARPGLVMAANHPLATSRATRLADCLRHGFILPDRSIGIRKFIEAAFQEAHVDLSAAVTTNSITLMKSMLRIGQSVAILSIFDVHSEVARGELAFLPIEDRKLEEETLVIATPSNRRPPPAAQAMIDIVRTSLDSIQLARQPLAMPR
ncbi:DNA-binding transcriptional LysR family regulator [Rhizobium sp. SG_E_25_P2]|uniref:LysR family transcriptional regulator n=1 Tax=Rhizobium sp. SG_E_25_P2 TaxID=2879942 RepID=UPI00247551D9|nr:LysR family transcriptional regulator [Rhizobium sp. SG_E_25_P2]MDH6267352.1 DNA-binding transcriptional LysR family regulator [Rhizobium sp. SG_E_25_P2]